MVYLITDGDETLSGTGFDSEINPQLARVKRQLPGASEPFLVTLLAIEGRFTDWRIFGGRGRPLLPTLPVRRAPEPEQTITGIEPRHNKRKIVESAQFNGEPAEPHRSQAKPDEKERFHQQMPIVFNFPPGANVVAPTTAVAAPLN